VATGNLGGEGLIVVAKVYVGQPFVGLLLLHHVHHARHLVATDCSQRKSWRKRLQGLPGPGQIQLETLERLGPRLQLFAQHSAMGWQRLLLLLVLLLGSVPCVAHDGGLELERYGDVCGYACVSTGFASYSFDRESNSVRR